MKTYYAWLLGNLLCSGAEQMSDYTDEFIFCDIMPQVKESDRDDILMRLFGFRIYSD